MTIIHNWKRFWCPREGLIDLSDGGYLRDPDAAASPFYKPSVVPFESMAATPCLVLLGEPGMGKTYAMNTEREAIDRSVVDSGGQTRWVDLRSYGSEDRLIRNLFEDSAFVSWVQGSHPLHLFLDSLDECLLRIDTLAALLVEELRKCPRERLWLRVACRTADWPFSLERGLKDLWGEESVGVYELAPLCREDVREAARVTGLDAEAFLEEVVRTEAVPLAMKPITLRFLLNIFQRDGCFPPTRAELYRQGCYLLCEEPSATRRDAGLLGALTAQQRLAVAARVAALTVLANRYAVWTDIDRGDVPDEDLTLQQACWGNGEVDNVRFPVTESSVREALSTGLFSSRGQQRTGWAHQTYAEFLAAHYLIQHHITLPQMKSLIVHPTDPDGKLVPQAYGAAVWLADQVPEIFAYILQADPEILLRGDLGAVASEHRAALVERLLQLYDSGELLDRNWRIRSQYERLAHPGLADQLRPYILDRTRNIVVRRVAIDIAEACIQQELLDDFLGIALDPTEPVSVREQAAYAVSRTGTDTAKARLKPLALGQAGDDPNDELKGCALRAVWPAHITTEELFAVLTHPKHDSLFGLYRLFLSQDLVPYLQPGDLPTALKWVEKEAHPREPRTLRNLADAIMLRAWEHLDIPAVQDAFIDAAFLRLRCGSAIIQDDIPGSLESALNSDDRRRSLLEAFVLKISELGAYPTLLLSGKLRLVTTQDVPWMIQRLESAESESVQRAWACLVGRAFDWRDPTQFEAVFCASQNNPVLAETFAWVLRPVELDSPEAQKMKEDYQEDLEGERERKLWQETQASLERIPMERIHSLLDEFETGDVSAWWQLNVMMLHGPGSPLFGEIEQDLALFPGWVAASTETRSRILRAAQRYVVAQEPETSSWFGKNIIHQPAFAGYRAFHLLAERDPDYLRTLSSEDWGKWAPMIVAYPAASGSRNEESHRRLIHMAYQYAPDQVIDALTALMDQECAEQGHIYITRKIKDCWDGRLAYAILQKARDKHLHPNCIGSLLEDLLDHGVVEARQFAESLLQLPLPPSGEGRAKALVAARVLATHSDDADWATIWPAFQQDSEFGRELVTVLSNGLERHTGILGLRLTEQDVADLYIWVARQYPHAEDPNPEGAHAISLREGIAMWRDSLLRTLQNRGTPQACEAIQRIVRELPAVEHLRWVLADARDIARRETWVPPRPEDILQMTRDSERRLVQNGDQLLDVVLESLRRLEAKLHADTPAVQFLWDRVEGGLYRPKDELAFSDWVKIHLEEDLRGRGIVVNREVQIHRGDRTDIRVDALAVGSRGDTYDPIPVIIEVKGNWHRDLYRAMETQLVGQYMRDSSCSHGLYLVGWFNCPLWDTGDWKQKAAAGRDLKKVIGRLAVRAAGLSQGERVVKAVIIDAALR